MPRAHANAFAKATPTRSDPTSPGPWVTATASTSARSRAGLRERRLDDAADVAHVLARRELGDDASPLAMDGGLRRDDGGPDVPGPRRIARFGDERRGGFVARGLDGEQVHGRSGMPVSKAPFRLSLYGGPKMPFSVMMPVM